MVTFPPAKINLGLNVVRKRNDGFHEIESVMMAIPLYDMLDVVMSEVYDRGSIHLERTGLSVPGDANDDLCIRAYRAFPGHEQWPGVRMHLHKVIPIGAGLGGGSSDGASALRALNELAGEPLSDEGLAAVAARMGSDCSFFLKDGAQEVAGKGEVLEPVDLDLEGYWLALIAPGIHVSTAEVYANTKPTGKTAGLKDVVQGSDPGKWRDGLVNVMEGYVFHKHPEIKGVKERLYAQGAHYASMSGSGSSVFGIFKERPELPELPANYRHWVLPLGQA
jgi:4-diphosphocytidyl-2-C-methyl-D-erythritol kinase